MILNPAYTFKNYLTTNSNAAIRNALLSIISLPGQIHNPLFIYGATGVGKTHLLQAVAYEAIKQEPYLNIYYATSENFVNDIIQSIQTHRHGDFINHCEGLDILLLDDVHLLKGRKHTLKELLCIFKRLYDRRKQIIVTADMPPKELFGTRNKIAKIFQEGTTFEMVLPIYEDRLNFLKVKAEKSGLLVNHDIFKDIACKTQLGFRGLEGALARIKLYSSDTSLTLISMT